MCHDASLANIFAIACYYHDHDISNYTHDYYFAGDPHKVNKRCNVFGAIKKSVMKLSLESRLLDLL